MECGRDVMVCLSELEDLAHTLTILVKNMIHHTDVHIAFTYGIKLAAKFSRYKCISVFTVNGSDNTGQFQ